MTCLKVLTYPDSFLKTVAKPVTAFDESLKKIITDMTETMYASKGIGLAAIQVRLDQRLFVADVEYHPDNNEIQKEPLVFINPEIIKREGERPSEEGCLSTPEIRAQITRSESITLKYQDIDQNTHELKCSELLAVCVQHECDHLDGKLFIDYLPLLKRKMAQNKLKRLHAKHS